MNVTLNTKSHNMYATQNFRAAQNTTIQAYRSFSNELTNIVNKKHSLNINKYYGRFYELARAFNKEDGIREFTKLSRSLMEFLVSKDCDNMAGIICSILIRFNKETNNSKNVEDLALRGIAIARRSNDVVHIAARANDMNVVLRQKEPGSDRHIKYLKVQNQALEDLCRDYNKDVVKKCSTNSKELAPLENYEGSLCYVKLDIATYDLLKEPGYAKSELEKAKKIYARIRNFYPPDIAEVIDKRIESLEQKYKLCGF